MCLNCLPYFEKCVFCISLKAAAVLISLSGLICTTCLIVLTLLNVTGITSQGSVNYSLWFMCIMILWLVSFIILTTVWSGLVQNEDARDVLLQIYFWLSITIGVIQMIFCVMLFLHFGMVILRYLLSILLQLPALSSVMTGVLTLGSMLQNSNISYKKVQILSAIKDPKDIIQKIDTIVSSGICMMSCMFMFTGLMLFFGTISDNDGLIQIFVWVTFLNVIFGYILVLAVGYQCMMTPSCILSAMDWLSGSAFLVCLIGYLSLWIYFISVANSYVMSTGV